MDITMPIPLVHSAPRMNFMSGAWAGGHQLKAAGYVLAGLIGLAMGPVFFMAIDHTVVVRWSNAILDLISSP
ncbi:MAG TPA: hypothetical protein VGB82_06310 [Alphaproteobacteria bacterium]